MREITNLIEAGLVHVPQVEMLPLEDAARIGRLRPVMYEGNYSVPTVTTAI
jgi:hypothetical protein